MNVAAQTKVHVNLETVTPMAPPPKSIPMDTKTPMDTSVVSFTQLDMPKWGEWLLTRLSEHFPHLNPHNFASNLAMYGNDRGALFIRTEHAIVMATAVRPAMDPRPVCDIVFLFKHHPDDEAESKEARLLLRRVDEWAGGYGCGSLRIAHPERCDVRPAAIKDAIGAGEIRVMSKVIGK